MKSALTGNHTVCVKWSPDRCLHVSLKCQGRDSIT